MSIFLMEFERESLKRAKNIAYIDGYEPLMAYKEKVLLRELETNYYVICEYDYDLRDMKIIGRKRKKKEEAEIDFFSYSLPQYDRDTIQCYVEDTVLTESRTEEIQTMEEQTITPVQM